MFEQRRHIATLDGLRGFAALIVVWLHMTTEAFKVSTPYRGYLAVDFFFILSGFVIAGAYEQRLLVGMPFSEFVRLRLIRLYPLIVLAIVCGFSVKLTAFYLLPHHGYVCDNVSSIIIAGILGIFLLPSHVAINPDFFPLDSPLWSLMFELWANLLYAFIASLANARQLRAAVWALAICGGIGLIPSVKLFGYLHGGHTIPEMGVGFARVGWGFFAGVVLHGLLTPARVARIPRVPFPMLCIVLLLAISPGPALGPFYDVFAAIVILPNIVALGSRDALGPRWRGPALFFGAISYPVYVLHYATFIHFNHFRGHSKPLTYAMFVAAMFLVVGTSYLALRFYDEPIRRWLLRVTRPVPYAASRQSAYPEPGVAD